MVEKDNYKSYNRQFRETHLSIPETRDLLVSEGIEKNLKKIQRCHRCGHIPRLVKQQYRSKNIYRYYFECRYHLGNRTFCSASIDNAYKCWKFINRRGEDNGE